MIFNWADTPGAFYAIAYVLSFGVMIANCSRRYNIRKSILIVIVFGSLIITLMMVTHGAYTYFFIPLMLIYFSVMCTMFKIVCTYDIQTTLYFSVRAFIMGEFFASFSFQMYYYAVKYARIKLSWGMAIGFVLSVDVILALVFYLLERRLVHMNRSLNVTKKEVISILLIGLSIYVTSNLNYLFEALNFAQVVITQLFTVRTMVDLGGTAILFAYHSQLVELNSRYEVMHLQEMLEMQQNNYEILKQSVEVVNQKYHDLKYNIAVLKDEIGSKASVAYLEQMENDIKAYEANNKTGNQALDTILTAKSLYCQSNWIELTCVAEGEALGFMDPLDIATLFGNILDNAIESVSKIEHKERRLIHVAVVKQKGFVRIRVENCYEEQPKTDGKNLVTSKEDKRYHGFGIKSIKTTVKKYGGSTAIQAEKGWFEIRILIPIPS